MKLLLDQNLSFKLSQHLSDLFPGSTQARLVGLAEADDRTLWLYARDRGFTIVSHDSDLAEMAALFGPPPKVIWLRRGNRPTSAVERMLRENAEMIAAFARDSDSACLRSGEAVLSLKPECASSQPRSA